MSQKLRWIIENIEEMLCAFLMMVMAVLSFVNVLTRYFIHYSFAFTEEIEVSLLVFLTMFGAAAAFRRGAHLGLSFLVNRFPRPLQKGLVIFSACLTVSLFLLLIYFGLYQIHEERAMGTVSEALEVPQWWYTSAVPLGAVFIIWRVIQATLRYLGSSSEG